MPANPPKRLRMTPEQLKALDEVASLQVPPIKMDSYGAFPEILGRVVLWSRDVLCHRVRLCPVDLAPLNDDLSCPKCGGHWTQRSSTD